MMDDEFDLGSGLAALSKQQELDLLRLPLTAAARGSKVFKYRLDTTYSQEPVLSVGSRVGSALYARHGFRVTEVAGQFHSWMEAGGWVPDEGWARRDPLMRAARLLYENRQPSIEDQVTMMLGISYAILDGWSEVQIKLGSSRSEERNEDLCAMFLQDHGLVASVDGFMAVRVLHLKRKGLD